MGGYADRGILKLDNTTFDRIIDGSRSVFVRFDEEYSYGEEHDAWKEYAKAVGESAADLLSADVGVSEYGDKDNSDLAERFGVKTDDFPRFLLFTKGMRASDSPIVYSGAKKTEEFLRFAQEKAGAWIGLPGQIKELDALAKELAGAADKAVVIKKAEAIAADSKEDLKTNPLKNIRTMLQLNPYAAVQKKNAELTTAKNVRTKAELVAKKTGKAAPARAMAKRPVKSKK